MHRPFTYTRLFFKLLIAICILSSLAGCKGGGAGTTDVGNPDPVDTFSYKGYANLANVLAGKTIADKSFLKNIVNTDAYKTHTASMTSRWGRYCTSDVNVIRKWSKDNLKQKTDSVFYPFGGLDFNYVASFFPDSRFSVLVGLEKPGKLPFTDKLSLDKYPEILTAMRAVISSNIGLSYFHTLQMEEDLDCYLKGTMPVIMMYASLHGFEVLTVNGVRIAADGSLEYTEPEKVFAHTMDKKIDDGFEMLYRLPGEKGARRVYYLCSDLSDSVFPESGMARMIEKNFKGKFTFLKVASYLLHEPDFSLVKESILDNSGVILSGPSGMPFAAYDKSQWDISLYGNYVASIPMFCKYPQDDLKTAYKTGNPQPINFRFDYHSSASFTLATRK